MEVFIPQPRPDIYPERRDSAAWGYPDSLCPRKEGDHVVGIAECTKDPVFFHLSQNVYSAQKFIYLRFDKIDHE
jgi:hypothetical protein